MSQSNIDIKDYEKNRFGEFSIISIDGEPGWNLQVNIEANKKLFKDLISIVEQKYPYMGVLRLIVITSDVHKTYNKIIKSIDGKREITAPIGGNLIAGKAFRWGNINSNNFEEYYAAIVLNEQFVAGALFNDEVGLAMLTHELAHVAEGVFEDLSLGIDNVDALKVDEWDKLKFSIARSMNSEYRANIMAFPFLEDKHDVLWESILETIQYLELNRDFMFQKVMEYQYHSDLYRLWVEVVDPIYRSFSGIGRAIGFLKGLDKSYWDEFAKLVKELDVEWGNLITKLRDQLYGIDAEEYKRESFEKLADAAEEGFAIMGFKPYYDENRIFKIAFS